MEGGSDRGMDGKMERMGRDREVGRAGRERGNEGRCVYVSVCQSVYVCKGV